MGPSSGGLPAPVPGSCLPFVAVLLGAVSKSAVACRPCGHEGHARGS